MVIRGQRRPLRGLYKSHNLDKRDAAGVSRHSWDNSRVCGISMAVPTAFGYFAFWQRGHNKLLNILFTKTPTFRQVELLYGDGG